MDLPLSSGLASGREALLAGDCWTAVAAFESLVAATPSDTEAHYWLASAKLLARDFNGAEQALDTARILHSVALVQGLGIDVARCRTDPAYANQAANHLYAENLMAPSVVIRGLAVSAGVFDVNNLMHYALALQHQGRAEAAIMAFRWAAERFPSSAIEQFAIYSQLFCEDGERRHATAARAWASLYARAEPAPVSIHATVGDGRLRIGYVAPSFAASQLRQFIAPILENHDPAAVRVVLYTDKATTDANWPAWIEVRQIGQLSDRDAADLIRRDGIDILNDCWGHTAGSRLGVFALKPAPVQAAWINFFQTTGLSQMDYVLHAATDVPPDGLQLFTETLWPLGPVFTPFRPAAGRLPPCPTPARRGAGVTFGSFNHPAKHSPATLDAWAEVLRRAPSARLLLKYRYFADPVLQRAFRTQFAARGVAPERLAFEGHTSGAGYYEAFQAVDLMLDSWPAPGSTTTLEALSNGVPVLAMVGAPANVGGLYAQTILRAVGLDELATTSPQAFVERALELASDIESLDRLRARVRPGFDASPICDEVGFTRNLERAYGEMLARARSPAEVALAGISA